MADVDVQQPADAPALTAEYVLPQLKNIIVPPPDLRPIVEKTAAYVAKHGTAFEAVILSKQQNDRRFDFLHPDNHYHSYYKSKLVQLLLPPEEQERLAQLQEEQEAERQALEELEAREAATDEAEAEAAPSKPVILGFRERLKLDIARSCQAHLIPTSAHELDPAYACVIPDNYGVNPLDREIIRLTARYVASQGKAFQNGLLAREGRNPTFDFMRSSHPYHHYFQGAIKAYEQIMRGRLAQVEKELNNPNMVREDILGRIEYERIQEKLMGQKEKDDEKERTEMAMIDWHDFVVLRTVDFPDDEQLFLPAPFYTIEEINRALEAQQQIQADHDAEMDVDADMAVDNEGPPEVMAEAQVKDMALAERNRAQANALQFQKCPHCNSLVKANELSEHIRICLLDPRWKVQKEASLLKQRESNLISGSDISRHLSELARRRQDIFTTPNGAAPEPVQEHIQEAPSEPEMPYIPPGHMIGMQPQGQYRPPALPNQSMQGFPQPVQYPQYGTMPPQQGPPIPYMGPGYSQQPYHHVPQQPQPHLMHQQMQPPMPTHHMPPPPPPPPKRTRILEPADKWAAKFPSAVDVIVQLPNLEDSDSNLKGQVVTLTVSIKSTALDLKIALSPSLDKLAPKKMKLQIAADGRWLKDAESLAELNLEPGVRLNFELKERGRKK